MTPIRSLHSPPPLAASSTPFSSQKVTNNQSFVSYVEPEPVQTPSTKTRGPSAAPELRLLDSLLGTVQALKNRLDEHEVRLERVEKDNRNLEEKVRYWQAEAARWKEGRQEARREMFLHREDGYRQFRREDDVPELHRDEDGRERRRDNSRRESWRGSQDARDWKRGNDVRESPRDDGRREWERHDNHRSGFTRSDSRRSSEWDEASRRSGDQNRQDYYRTSPGFRTTDASPGSRFVEELSGKLPLETDQYEVLVSLMNRYLADNTNG